MSVPVFEGFLFNVPVIIAYHTDTMKGLEIVGAPWWPAGRSAGLRAMLSAGVL